VQKSSIDAKLWRSMTKRKTAKPDASGYETQVTIRLSAEMLAQIAEIRRRAGFGARAEIMREALELGLADILKRYAR
jgi:hypothetical protein